MTETIELTEEQQLRAWRTQQFMDLKFTQKEAEALADATTISIVAGKSYEFPLHKSEVKAMIDAGASAKQILRILT